MKCAGFRGRGNNVMVEGMNERGKKGVWLLKRDMRTQRGSSHNPVIVCWPRVCMCVCVLFAQSCLTLCNPMDCRGVRQAPLSMEFSRQEYWSKGYHSLLQEIFPTQGSNLGLPHCRQVLYRLNYQGSPLAES